MVKRRTISKVPGDDVEFTPLENEERPWLAI